MRPLIGITSGEVYNKEHPWSPYVYGQSHTYVNAVLQAGGTPIIFPITADTAVIDQLLSVVDGMLFAGGNDVTPALYDQKATYTKDNSEARDAFEITLLKRCLDTNKPLLAICRGMQLLNVVRGGTLYQDISKEVAGSDDHDISNKMKSIEHAAHTLAIEPGSKLATILDSLTISSNSHHHQAVNKVGKGLHVNARAKDGIIEGLESVGDTYIIGVQSHPESLFASVEPKWKNLFMSFIAAASVKQ